VSEHRRNMIEFMCLADESCSPILNSLERSQGLFRKTKQELGLGVEEPGAGVGEEQEVIPTQEGVASLGHGGSTHSPCSLMLMPMITPGERI
jgi:hypothetical protein